MAPTVFRDSLPIRDPYWTHADYLRLADHPSSDVRFWALDRMEELELDIPAEVLRRRLDDPDGSVAVVAARLIGDREIGALADDLLARVNRAEDAAGAGDPGVPCPTPVSTPRTGARSRLELALRADQSMGAGQ